MAVYLRLALLSPSSRRVIVQDYNTVWVFRDQQGLHFGTCMTMLCLAAVASWGARPARRLWPAAPPIGPGSEAGGRAAMCLEARIGACTYVA